MSKVHFEGRTEIRAARLYRVAACGSLWEDAARKEYLITKEACLVTCQRCAKNMKVSPQP